MVRKSNHEESLSIRGWGIIVTEPYILRWPAHPDGKAADHHTMKTRRDKVGSEFLPAWMSLLVALGIITVAFGTVSSHAAERLANVFADNMVLQRDIAVPIWGWSEKGQVIKVSFADQDKTATADESGRWMLRLDPLPASKEPRQMTVTGSTTQVVNNILVGDVWICSGQSNMSWFLQDSTNGKAEMSAANDPNMRFLRVSQTNSPFPLEDSDLRLSWEICAPVRENMWMTAVGFYFARELLKEVDVPIGLIGANLGSTCIETWIPISGFRSVPELGDPVDLHYKEFLAGMRKWLSEADASMSSGEVVPNMPVDLISSGDFQQPAKCFNGMINPIIPFAIRGVIWYQGESNGAEGESYFHKMKALISSWRTLWNQDHGASGKGRDFPFYFVQLANFQPSNPDNPAGGETWTRLREAQLRALSIPNTGMAVAIDIGEAENVHPANKQDVGRRLALWALAKNYGKEVAYSGPLYKSHAVEGNKIRIAFEHVGRGLCVAEKKGLADSVELLTGQLKCFAIAGDDQKWRWADAVIDGDTVVVSHPDVPAPVAVRYAFALNPGEVNFYNKDGLPASPFRTDQWP